MKKILSALLAGLMLCTLCLTGCDNTTVETPVDEVVDATEPVETVEDNADVEAPAKGIAVEDLKVAFLYVGPIGDLGYSYAHDQGRLAIEKEFGIKTHYVENVPETAECETQLRQLCEEGYNVIYATSFGYGEWVEKVAADYPNVYFGHATGYIVGDNYGNYMGRVYEARYLAGIVAGLNTETNKIGYVAAMPIAEVIRGINAFTLGVRSVNPEATVEVIWTNTWFDLALEKTAAQTLIANGVDVMAQHCDSTAPQLAAQEAGIKAIGYNSSTPTAAPKAYMTAPLFHWGVYYTQDIQKIVDGTWEGATYWEGLSAGMVSLDTLTDNCVEGTAEAVAAAQEKIENGELVIFKGEIKDNTGAVKVAADQVLTDAELTSLDWLVEGVIGSIN